MGQASEHITTSFLSEAIHEAEEITNMKMRLWARRRNNQYEAEEMEETGIPIRSRRNRGDKNLLYYFFYQFTLEEIKLFLITILRKLVNC